MDLIGKVIQISEARTGVSKTTGNPWMVQEYVIETNENFPKRMMFSVFGEEKIKQFNIQPGEEIKVFFDINAREYMGKFYNDIRAWRIDRPPFDEPTDVPPPFATAYTPQQNPVAAPSTSTTPATQPTATAPTSTQPLQTDNEDDLPF